VVANKEYQYRVTAENEGGESKPSEPSDLIKAKPLKGLTRLCLLSFYLRVPIKTATFYFIVLGTVNSAL